MALSRTKLPKLRISRSMPRFQFRSSSVRSTKPGPGTAPAEIDYQKIEFLSDGVESGSSSSGLADQYMNNNNGINKVVVVVGSGPQDKGALDWALSHAIQNQDTVVLLFVTKAPTRGVISNLNTNLKAYEILHSMKVLCQNRKPGVRVEVVLQEAKEKGPAIVEEAKQQSASLLVLGQRKRPIIWRLIMRRWGPIGKRSKTRGPAVDYCIQNASCMTIAVRRKGKRLGGYLITTKRHKNFWLLA